MERTHCDDCGARRVTRQGEVRHGFGSVITQDGQSRLYCSECKAHRGLAHLFDPRHISAIEAAQKDSAA